MFKTEIILGNGTVGIGACEPNGESDKYKHPYIVFNELKRPLKIGELSNTKDESPNRVIMIIKSKASLEVFKSAIVGIENYFDKLEESKKEESHGL